MSPSHKTGPLNPEILRYNGDIRVVNRGEIVIMRQFYFIPAPVPGPR